MMLTMRGNRCVFVYSASSNKADVCYFILLLHPSLSLSRFIPLCVYLYIYPDKCHSKFLIYGRVLDATNEEHRMLHYGVECCITHTHRMSHTTSNGAPYTHTTSKVSLGQATGYKAYIQTRYSHTMYASGRPGRPLAYIVWL